MPEFDVSLHTLSALSASPPAPAQWAAQERRRIAKLCELAAAERYAVLTSDAEQIGALVAVEHRGRAAGDQLVIEREPQVRQWIPITEARAVDAADRVVVLSLDRRALDRLRFSLVS